MSDDLTDHVGGPPPPPPPPGARPTGWSGWGGAPPPPATTDGAAIASLVLGILSFVVVPFVGAIVAIALGMTARKRIDASDGRIGGRGLAVGGLALGIANLVVVLVVAAFVALIVVTSERETHVGGGVATSIYDITVGDCYSTDDPDSDIDTAMVVDCDEPHTNEVYAIHEYEAAEYPGSSVLEDAAVEVCLDRFADYVGIDYYDSIYEVYYLYPSARSWKQADDREIVCTASSLDGSLLTSSVRGARR